MQYFCTAGRGTETFIYEELQALGAEQLHHIDGKVFFHIECHPRKLLELKSVERLFTLVHYDKDFSVKKSSGINNLRRTLQSITSWQSCVAVLKRFKAAQGCGSVPSEAHHILKKCLLQVTQNSPLPACSTTIKCDKPHSNGQKEQYNVSRCQSSSVYVQPVSDGSTTSLPHVAASCMVSEDTEPPKKARKFEHYTVSKVSHQEKSFQTNTDAYEETQHGKGGLDDTSNGCVTQSNEEAKQNEEIWQEAASYDQDTVCQSRDRETAGNAMYADTSPSESPLTFRVSCKCTGHTARWFSPQNLGKITGIHISKQLGWSIQLKNPQIEIFLQINNDGILIGIPLCQQPLSRRSYIKTIGLRSPVAWIMCFLAKIKVGDVVLDPMCGAATILLEANNSWPGATYLGCDISTDQLQKAQENVEVAKEQNHIHLFQADVCCLPLATASVDVVVCDVPFGVQHGNKQQVKNMYPGMLLEMNRIVKPGGRVVLLTSATLKDDLLKAVCEVTRHSTSQTGHSLEINTVSSSTEECDLKPNLHTDRSECITGGKTDELVLPSNRKISNYKPPTELYRSNLDLDTQRLVPKNAGRKSVDSLCQWTSDLVHYLKLGEMHAYVCMFTKH